MTDHVPVCIWQVPQSLGLLGEFLHPIFPKHSNTSVVGLPNQLYRESLTDGHKCDLFCPPPASPSRRRHALSNETNVLRDGHGSNHKLERTRSSTKEDNFFPVLRGRTPWARIPSTRF